ncbi:protein ABHD11-like [Ctenocephalides felis]|uniref:protein ABHD11-like n=1 Tax=Ctenocephalides felis TaxID=7515 RepID=UPI000E6E1DE1|nr:protein ABHD11-like [Ctenocephalides felis]
MAYTLREPRSLNEKMGKPLVILHGMMGSKQNWNSISLMLKNGLDHSREIYMMDIRNHGESPNVPEHNQELMIQDCLHTFKHLKLEKPIVLGHSMGGRIMMLLALKHESIISGLIVVEMSYHSYSDTQELMIELANFMRQITFEDVNNSLPQARAKAHKILAQKVKSKFMRNFLVKIKWRLNLEVLGKAKPQGFPEYAFKLKYPGPCIFLGGNESHFVQKDDLIVLRKMFPQAELYILEGGGHLLHVDRPREFVAIVTNFLNKMIKQNI